MATEQSGDRLPFEPQKKRQKPAKNKNSQPEAKKTDKQPQQSQKADKPAERTPRLTKEEMAVPKVVSDRMARRLALFCGVPTALGMLTFIVSYQIVSHGWFKLPHIAVLLVSMGFFGLGVLGLSYGILSASWDEDLVGSKLGWQEFKANWQRMVSVWRSTKQKNV